jgi:hypothetical protein
MPRWFIVVWFLSRSGWGLCGGESWLTEGSLQPPWEGSSTAELTGPAFGGVISCVGCLAASVVGCHVDIYGEFDSGSGRTLAACLTHASRTVTTELALSDQWRTGE